MSKRIGTLIPFVVGYVIVNGFDPTGLLLMLGMTNIFLALVYFFADYIGKIFVAIPFAV